MVQFYQPPPRKPSFGAQLSQGLGNALNMGAQLMGEKRERENIGQLIGMDVSNIRDPKILQGLTEQYGKQKNERAKLAQDTEIESRDYDIVKESFGEKFANVWKSAPQGGKTELIKYGLDALTRGEDINELLNNVTKTNAVPPNVKDIPNNVPQLKNGMIDPEFQWPDFSKREQGYTPKEWNDARKEWTKTNVPRIEENSKHLKNIKSDQLATKKLKQLNPKIQDGFSRFLINPETGDFYGAAQILGFKSPEAQQWSKVIARFQNRAKDAFGSRVTNFDLQSYMKQFPDLINTAEGRERILDMMEINYELDSLYDTALQRIYDKYGAGGIPPEKAEELARKMIKEETDRLERKYLFLDEENQIEESKPKLTGKMINVIGPNGEEGEMDEGELKHFPGFRPV